MSEKEENIKAGEEPALTKNTETEKTKRIYTEEEKDVILSFTDFYLFSNKVFENSFMYYPEIIKPQKIKKDEKELFIRFIHAVKNAYNEANKREDFITVFEDRCFRVCAMKHTTNGLIFAIRQTNVSYNDIKKLNLGNIAIKELLNPRLNSGGLIIVSGAPGNGKSTTSAALIIKRLNDYGGLCITVEDPPEFPLEGEHGKGYCIQNQVEEKGGFAGAIKTSMRAYPTGQKCIMFVGEVRDAETAVEVIKASIDGRLVIATLHAKNVYSAIKRLAALASDELGDEAYSMLSESFKVGIHQTLKKKASKTNRGSVSNQSEELDKERKPIKKESFEMNIECLVNTTPCVNIIRENNIDRLRNEMQQQKSKWNNNKKVIYHSETNEK